MFKVLNEKEVNEFVEKYFKIWKKDIWKVTSIKYDNITEYMINEHYLFKVEEDTTN